MAADAATMRAIAVRPGVADSLHARDVRRIKAHVEIGAPLVGGAR
jgi:hypothetical protein